MNNRMFSPQHKYSSDRREQRKYTYKTLQDFKK